MANGRRLPNIIVIGAMKCGTTAVHDLLDRHPHIAMSQPKELNFFFGPDNAANDWTAGNWSRGVHWYTRQFDLDAPLLGESSPGYTSPAHPCVAQRMAAIVPDAKLLYLVRDPIIRAISQYEHHRADGTEHRALADALTDPTSQYIARGRYSERLQPFLAHYPRAQIMIVVQEDLRDDPATTLRAIFTFVGADPSAGPCTPSAPDADSERLSRLDPAVRAQLVDALHDDTDRLRAMLGRALTGWTV